MYLHTSTRDVTHILNPMIFHSAYLTTTQHSASTQHTKGNIDIYVAKLLLLIYGAYRVDSH